MKISVARLFAPDIEHLEVDAVVRPHGDLAQRYPDGARMRGKVWRISHGVFLEGEITGRERETCGRCLELFERAVRVPVSEAFSEDVPAGEALFSDVAPLVDRQIDLDELVVQLLEVDEPLKALCDEQCLGICAVCGGNRNVTPCDCSQATIDPRLAGLARLLEERGTE